MRERITLLNGDVISPGSLGQVRPGGVILTTLRARMDDEPLKDWAERRDADTAAPGPR
ncbi:hypothetical protein JIX56_27070 [Streptomyces sp. CA-210063]|uniref:hypothetical protein n=1 Tax=Streptomyces sp. CA-210063 TaxID=2801029 RepID=UPI00214BFFEE|nr:hypothetical protein [Streptomyces sp. CA-210063]UUU33232.1 hypothetical protein JIX56_27070 [Streptomyces sp. CA-210063]